MTGPGLSSGGRDGSGGGVLGEADDATGEADDVAAEAAKELAAGLATTAVCEAGADETWLAAT
jgi:hypothetical protein